MHSNSAPGVDGEPTTPALVPSGPADDSFRRLLGNPPDPVTRFGFRHWLGLLALVGTTAVAAVVMPTVLTTAAPDADRPVAMPSSVAPSAVPPPVALPSATTSSPNARAPSPGPAGTADDRGSTASAPGTTAAATARPPTTRPARPDPGPGGTTERFSGITVEAETGSLSGGASVTACAACRGGARVRYLGRVDIRVTIPTPGAYDVTVFYGVVGARKLDISISGGSPIPTQTVSGTSWSTPTSVTVRATLPAGPVDIGLHAAAGNAPDIDAVAIS
ncbi:hypothetical protein ACQPZK_20830 [Micromonospora sp. CA-249363]|uniref:hypothetical protein n=1 Tax=Micromonospora sp. CA-249363 TaxID=3239963 RepID=UPI003D8D87B9